MNAQQKVARHPGLFRSVLSVVSIGVFCIAGCLGDRDHGPSTGPDQHAENQSNNDVARVDNNVSPRIKSKDALRERAEQLWQARKDRDWATVCDFRDSTDPAGEDGRCESWHEENEPFGTERFTLEGVEIEGKMGWVHVDQDVSMRRFPNVMPRHVNIWENWRFIDGDWYPVPKQQLESYPDAPANRDRQQEAKLLKRFNECWTAREQRNWDKLYSMIDPRLREQVPREEFAQAENLDIYLSHKAYWAEAIGEHGRVRAAITHRPNDPNLTKMEPSTVYINERWVLVDGEWYFNVPMPEERKSE